MTQDEKAEEKAKELVNRFFELSFFTYQKEAKNCALICVDEILMALKFINDSKWYVEQTPFWQNVKSKIETQ